MVRVIKGRQDNTSHHAMHTRCPLLHGLTEPPPNAPTSPLHEAVMGSFVFGSGTLPAAVLMAAANDGLPPAENVSPETAVSMLMYAAALLSTPFALASA